MLFAHITTHLEGRERDGMLSDVGGMGFPTMVFLDATGGVLASHEGPRSTDGFDATAEEAQAYIDLAAKAAGGDETAKVELFMKDMALGRVTLAQAKQRVGDLEITDEQRADIDEKLVNLEFDEAFKPLTKAGGDPEKTLETAGAKMHAMQKAGRVPTSQMGSRYFWQVLMQYARKQNDVELFAVVVDNLKKQFADEPRAQNFLKGLDKQLEDMRKAKEGDGDGDGGK